MGVSIYDQALITKLQSWTQDTNINILGPDDTQRLFEIIADSTKDKPIKLPLISIKRAGGYSINRVGKTSMTYRGIRTNGTPGIDGNGVLLNAIPITLTYQVDIYTRYLSEADALTRNLVFNFINYPNLTVELPYNDEKIEHDSTINIMTEIEDNSSIPERLYSGQFSRMSIGLTITDAYLWDVRVKDNIYIDPNVIILTEKENIDA